MAINKKLIHFKSKTNFDEQSRQGNILDNSIVFIQDSKEISTHGTIYKSVNWSVLAPPPINLCDIAYWDGSKVKTIAKDKYTTNLGTAIGVVVIPEGMLPDGRARIMGLKPVDANGNASDSHVGIKWGVYGTDTSLTNYTKVPTTDNAGSTSTGSNDYGYLPSDKLTGSQSVVDGKAKYKGSTPFVPSPYLGDDKTFNLEYCKDIIDYNTLSDFNGLSNTEVLVGLGSNYVAANAAWNYKDAANSTVQWYLPAMGELGFLMPRFNEINSAVTGVGGVAVGGSSYFWSSSEFSSNNAYNLSAGSGSVGNYGKNDRYSVRVFGII